MLKSSAKKAKQICFCRKAVTILAIKCAVFLQIKGDKYWQQNIMSKIIFGSICCLTKMIGKVVDENTYFNSHRLYNKGFSFIAISNYC